MRCPSCGARNIATAAWCTQCFEVLGREAGSAGAAPAPAVGGEPVTAAPPTAPPTTPPTAPSAGGQRDIRVAGDRIEWRCARCEGWSPMEGADCAACGSPRVGFTPATPGPVAAPQGAGPLVASALLPGLGHLLLGHLGSGTARLLLWLLWAGGAALILAAAGVTIAAVVLGTAAAGLWILSLHDLFRLADGRPQVLSGRVLAWSVVAVTALMVLAGLASAGGARP